MFDRLKKWLFRDFLAARASEASAQHHRLVLNLRCRHDEEMEALGEMFRRLGNLEVRAFRDRPSQTLGVQVSLDERTIMAMARPGDGTDFQDMLVEMLSLQFRRHLREVNWGRASEYALVHRDDFRPAPNYAPAGLSYPA